MKILLTGASGFIGRNLAAALTMAGHQVVPASRRDGMDFRQMLSPAVWIPRLDGVDAVINAVGIIGETGRQRFESLHTLAPIALFQACVQTGVRRVVQISALGADDTAVSAYHLSKRAADDGLRELDLDWFVLKPSLVYGRGGRSAALFMRMATLPLIPVIGDGRQMLQPVHISDLVAAVVQALTSPDVRQTLDVVGAERISFADWLQAMRRTRGQPRARLLHVPALLAMTLMRVASVVSPLLRADNLRMLQRGSVGDCQLLTQFLGRRPLGVGACLLHDGNRQGRN